MIIGIILAAGEGTRMKVQGASKTAILFAGKPLVSYGVDLYSKCVDQTYIVVGAHRESITSLFPDSDTLHYVEQTERRGTGHALMIALEQIKQDGLTPDLVLLGYGDHMMYYTPAVLHDLIALHRQEQSTVSLISTVYDDPDFLAWGRIIRDEQGKLVNIVEQNDATLEQRKIKESNAGFYCIDYQFALRSMETVQATKQTGEYYVNDFTYLALNQGKHVSVLQVPFAQVGIGINTHDQLTQSSELFKVVNEKK